MRARDWLTARPVAHRGLHDAAHGVIENTPSAVSAAIAAEYAIEVDLQITADGEAMVHHDEALGRLTDGARGAERDDAADLRRVAFQNDLRPHDQPWRIAANLSPGGLRWCWN